jgi:hypothetical protein
MLEEYRTLRQEMLQARQAWLLILGFSSAAIGAIMGRPGASGGGCLIEPEISVILSG